MGTIIYFPPAGGGPAPIPTADYLTSGIISGLDIQAVVGGTTFSIGAGEFFSQDISNPAAIVSQRVTVGAGDYVNEAITNIGTDDFTYLFLIASGGGGSGIIQRTTPPQKSDLVDGLVYLGNLSHDDGTGVLTFAPTNLGWSAFSSTLNDNIISFLHGTIRENGVRMDFNGNGFTPVITAGSIIRLGTARLISPSSPDTATLNVHTYGTGPGPTFRVFSDGGTGLTIQAEPAITPNNYDDGSGTLAAGNTARWYRHYFYVFPVAASGDMVVFHQFDVTDHASLEDAINAERIQPLPFLEEAALVGVLHLRGSSTDPYADIIAGLAELIEPPTVRNLYR